MNRTFRLLIFGFLITLIIAGVYIYTWEPTPQEDAKVRLTSSALVSDSVWNPEFFEKNPIMKEKVIQFEKGALCPGLKKLDNASLTHREILNQLKTMGYKCLVRPLAVNPTAPELQYLKTDNSITSNPDDPDVARQEVCYEEAQPVCVIRIKRDGFPRNRRSGPHSSKAVMIDAEGDPGSYDNEAFKVGASGEVIPKGPSLKFGLKRCPYPKNKKWCEAWVDAIMGETHPDLIEPVRSIN